MLLLITWALLAVGAWFGYELLRQNARILQRLERAEARIETLAGYAAAGPRPFVEMPTSRSRINRSGLSPGTPAPTFTLRVDGEELSLAD